MWIIEKIIEKIAELTAVFAGEYAAEKFSVEIIFIAAFCAYVIFIVLKIRKDVKSYKKGDINSKDIFLNYAIYIILILMVLAIFIGTNI